MDIADIFYGNFETMENRTEYPILFSTPMVQAILEGRKTMTRRILKVQGCKPFFPDDTWSETDIIHWTRNGSTCPYGVPGDLLWVRETFSRYRAFGEDQKDNAPFIYLADKDECDQYPCLIDGEIVYVSHRDKWKPSIHMPKSAARIWLEITDVRVERLQDISNADALKEGIKVIEPDEAYYDYMQFGGSYLNPRGSFFSLWEKINGKESLEQNPWVWVVEFKRVYPCL